MAPGVCRAFSEDEGRGRTTTIVGDDGTEDAYVVAPCGAPSARLT